MNAETDIDARPRDGLLVPASAKREPDEWLALVAAMEDDPGNVALMLVAADFLDERGDIRGECLRWMAESGKTGCDKNGSDAKITLPYYIFFHKTHSLDGISVEWMHASNVPNMDGGIRERTALLHVWAEADEDTRRRWMADSLPKVEPEATNED